MNKRKEGILTEVYGAATVKHWVMKLQYYYYPEAGYFPTARSKVFYSIYTTPFKNNVGPYKCALDKNGLFLKKL